MNYFRILFRNNGFSGVAHCSEKIYYTSVRNLDVTRKDFVHIPKRGFLYFSKWIVCRICHNSILQFFHQKFWLKEYQFFSNLSCSLAYKTYVLRLDAWAYWYLIVDTMWIFQYLTVWPYYVAPQCHENVDWRLIWPLVIKMVVMTMFDIIKLAKTRLICCNVMAHLPVLACCSIGTLFSYGITVCLQVPLLLTKQSADKKIKSWQNTTLCKCFLCDFSV